MCCNTKDTTIKKTSSPDKQQSSRKREIYSILPSLAHVLVSRGWLVRKGIFSIAPYCFFGVYRFDIAMRKGGHLKICTTLAM